MIAVGIETSGPQGSVAIVHDSECLDDRSLSRTGRRHARTLVLELRQLLDSAEITPAQLDVVAVSIGPGSFTGLRVGVVCAKTIAYATRATLIAVDSFQAVAENAPADVASQYIIGNAQRDDVFVGQYHQVDNRWERAGDIRIAPFEQWRDDLPDNAIVSGPGLSVFGTRFADSARLLSGECWTPRSSFVARIGLQRAAQGCTDDPFTIQPFYLRKSGAEENLLAKGTQQPAPTPEAERKS